MMAIVSLSRHPRDSGEPAAGGTDDRLVELAGPSGVPMVVERGGIIGGYSEEVAVAIELFVNEGPISVVDKEVAVELLLDLYEVPIPVVEK